jgi:hypothetical protein
VSYVLQLEFHLLPNELWMNVHRDCLIVRSYSFRVSKPAETIESTSVNTYTFIQIYPALGIKQPGHEADHSYPPTADVKNGGVIPPLPHTPLWHSARLIKDKDNFTYGGRASSCEQMEGYMCVYTEKPSILFACFIKWAQSV